MSDTHDRRDRIDRLAALDGAGTELVSVTVPPEKSLTSVCERISQEHASATNIKSDRTRTHVRQALDRVERLLRQYRQTPDAGLAIYAGVVEDELVSAVFDDLPEPITASTYRCDDHFDLEPVERAVAPGESYGLIVVERGAAAIGRLVGDRITVEDEFESQVMGASRAGGQSAQRFARERERQKHAFFETVADRAKSGLLGRADPVAGLVVGGTLDTARAFVDGDYLDHRLQERLLGTYGVEYATRRGLDQLVEAASESLLDESHREVREHLDAFFTTLRDDDPVAYGREDVERAIEYGAVDVALVSADLPGDRRRALETAVANQGGETVVVTSETERGAQFADAFGGVGALLRFAVN